MPGFKYELVQIAKFKWHRPKSNVFQTDNTPPHTFSEKTKQDLLLGLPGGGHTVNNHLEDAVCSLKHIALFEFCIIAIKLVNEL